MYRTKDALLSELRLAVKDANREIFYLPVLLGSNCTSLCPEVDLCNIDIKVHFALASL